MKRSSIPTLAALAIAAAGLAGCAGGRAPSETAAVPLFDGTGPHHRTVTTTSPLAQKYFDQGLAFLFGFNHDEAIRAFGQVAELDSTCAMAYWGIAYANGPHINNPVVPPERAEAAWAALGKAQANAARVPEVDRALIEALAARYAWPQPEDRAPLDSAYAETMRSVSRRFPDDPDVGALYGEALMDLHPWDLWTPEGKPLDWTPEIIEHLESVLAKHPNHPLAIHLYIHAVEASDDPGRADAAADRLRDMMPAIGHLVHMPSHIDVRRGRWEQAIVSNTKAMAADHRYLEREPHQGFYRLYMAHNHHMRAFAAMMIGQSELAATSMREMVDEFPEDWLRENALWADGWVAMPLEVHMRFGHWQQILDAPEMPDFLPLSTALRHYARGVAYAALTKVDEARAEQAAFQEARTAVSAEAFFGNNMATDILDVADTLLDGEIRYRAGDQEGGFKALREAVRREDALRYDEPPGWIQPVRHALGAALLQSRRYAEAEEVFRKDLAILPGNGWSQFGLGRALRLQGKDAEASEMEAKFAETWKNADVKITSSCFCQSGV